MAEAETLGDAVPPGRLLACPRCGSNYSNQTHRCGIDGEALVAPEQDFLIGRELAGYRILERIGVGAMGCVYRGVQVALDNPVAVKVLLGELGADERFVARFRREAQILHRQGHANVVRVLDFGRSPEGLAYLVMEYLEGRTLEALIEAEAPLSPERAVRLVQGIATGLQSIHEAGFVHRDIKPANVMVGPNGDAEIHLLDFGIAGRLDASKGTKLTATGKILGTPTYMAPEQAEDTLVTPAADLYSLGAIMYELLSGQPPFDGQRLGEVLVKHATLAPPPLPMVEGLETIVFALLAKSPGDRPGSAAELKQLLTTWESKRWPVTADVDQGPPPTQLRRKTKAGVGAAALAALALGFAWGRSTGTPTSPPSAPRIAPVSAPAPALPPPTPEPVDLPALEAASASAQVDPAPPMPVPAAADASEAHRERPEAGAEAGLLRALERRGLTPDELQAISALRPSLSDWKAAPKGSGARARAAGALLVAVEALPGLEPKVLSSKLDRVLRALQRSSDRLPAEALGRYEDEALALGERLRGGPRGEASFALARELSRLERSLPR